MSTKAFIIASHESHFFAYRNTQREAAPFLVFVKSLSDLRLSGSSKVICVGPFWTNPIWEQLLAHIRKQTIVNPAICIEWFPM